MEGGSPGATLRAHQWSRSSQDPEQRSRGEDMMASLPGPHQETLWPETCANTLGVWELGLPTWEGKRIVFTLRRRASCWAERQMALEIIALITFYL